jgi:pSer/pThr/pTyr-binding forkhead associated (FHA) protein
MYAIYRQSIRLVSLSGKFDIALGGGLTVIGRHPGCDVRIESGQVSRRHCCLSEVEGEVRVCDLGSTNGIRINGRRVHSGRLKPGNELAIAHLLYYVEMEVTGAMSVRPTALREVEGTRRGPSSRWDLPHLQSPD